MKINHIALLVKNIETVKDFYIRYFGAVPNEKYKNEKTGLQTYFLAFDGDVCVEIMSRPEVSVGDKAEHRTGFAHMAISVGSRENVDRLTGLLETEGHPVPGKPRVTGDGYYESVVLDPEGNRIEITE